MACFIVPMVQAIATSAWNRSHRNDIEKANAPVLMQHLPTLEKMLWGGTILLIVDHILSGELTWRFPFFTALDQAGGGLVMLREMLTVGVPMSVVLTAVWAVYTLLKVRKTTRLVG